MSKITELLARARAADASAFKAGAFLPAPTPSPSESPVYAGYSFDLTFTTAPSGNEVILIRPRSGEWIGEVVRPVNLYAGTRIGDWLHAQLASAVDLAQRNAAKAKSPYDIDQAAMGFSQGYHEDLAFARAHWDAKDEYWTAKV